MNFCQEIINKEIWENFFEDVQEKTFLQSWDWGEFQERMGNKIWRLGIYDDRGYDDRGSASVNLVSLVLAVKVAAKRGTFLLVQHLPSEALAKEGGPLENNLEMLLRELKEIAKNEGCAFIRIAPLLERNEENKKLFQNWGFREAPMHANAYEATWKLNITPSEEELLKNMRKTTRYLIRQAEKNPDLEITKSDNMEDIGVYQKLNLAVAKHQKFTPFSVDFVKNEFEIFAKDSQALLFFGKDKGEIIAAALVIFWSGIGFYHQAALDPKYHKIPIAYLLQWAAIKEAKNRGCQLYDFWGYVDPKSRHPWAGPTLFKMGFGGRVYEYVKTQDLPLSKKYWLIYAFEKLRKIKRGL